MSLKEKALAMNQGKKGIEFMQGRTKGELIEILDVVVTITDYEFLDGTDGEYAVFIIKEDNDKFYFGGSVLTRDLKEFTEEEKNEVKEKGLPVKFSNKKSKNKRNYTGVEFYPEDAENLPF